MPENASLPAAPPQTPGFPNNPQALTFSGFAGLNTKPSRPAIEEDQMYICDNFMPLGKSNLRTLWGYGESIYTVGGGDFVEFFAFINISSVSYCLVFEFDGSITAINMTTLDASTIAAPGTITNPGDSIGVSQWGSQYALIVAPQTNGYFVWDGTLFYQSGTIGPEVDIQSDGFDYQTAPSVYAVGGFGSGATFTATVLNGSIDTIVVNSPGSGYQLDDFVYLAFTGGGGAEATAAATITGSVSSASVTNSGSGYTVVPSVSFNGGGGTGATGVFLPPGIVTSVSLTNQGAGYTVAPSVTFSGSGGTGATATAILGGEGHVAGAFIINGGSGFTVSSASLGFTGGSGTGAAGMVGTAAAINSVSLTGDGSGYTVAPTVVFSGAGGSGAAAAATLGSPGYVAGAFIINGGSGFTVSTASLGFTGGSGSGATGMVGISSGTIATVTVTNGGSGYTSDPAGSVIGGGGSGYNIISFVGYPLSSVSLSNAGSGYTIAPSVSFANGGPAGGGSNATAVANYSGAINSVTVTSGGSGYTSNPAGSVLGGGGSGYDIISFVGYSVASIDVTNGGSGYTTGPAVAIFSGGPASGGTSAAGVAFAGSGSSISITAAGSGYTIPPLVTISGGGGTSAAAVSFIRGDVTSVSVISGGVNYSVAPTVSLNGGGGSSATAVAILTGTTVSSVSVTAAGSGYTVAPSVTFSGGIALTYETAVAAATITGGSVTAVSIINAGYGYTSTSTVLFGGGGGFGATGSVVTSGGAVTAVSVSGTSLVSGGFGYTSPPTIYITDDNNPVAQATVQIMPFGVQGTALETYQSRTWIVNGTAPTDTPPKSRVLFTAPGSPVDFSVGDGAGAFVSTDSFLRIGYAGIKQSNGFLYLVGDSSLNYISNPQTAGSPPETTFNNQNVDPQIGTPWPKTIQVFSRNVIWANPFGVFVSYGGAVTKVSDALDGIFTSVTPTGTPPSYDGLTPSAAVAVIFGIHVYILLLPIIDQVTGEQTNKLLMWDGKRWFTSSQSPNLIYIATFEINSVMTAYGTDGLNIYPLFQTPSNSVIKTCQSKSYLDPSQFYTKTARRLYALLSFYEEDGANIVATVDNGVGSMQPVTITAPSLPISSISSVSVTNAGSYADFPPAVTFSGGNGFGASAVAKISGDVVAISVSAGGSGYTVAPTVSITGGGGTGAAGIAIESAGTVASVSISAAGSGYSLAPNLSFSGGGGTGAAATTFIIGGVSGVSVTAGGFGYTSTPSVTFSGIGGATGVAALTSIVGAGNVYSYGPLPLSVQGPMMGLTVSTDTEDMSMISWQIIDQIYTPNV